MRQLQLPFDEFNLYPAGEELARETFSHNQVCADDARVALEERYVDFLKETDRFSAAHYHWRSFWARTSPGRYRCRAGLGRDTGGLGGGSPLAGSGSDRFERLNSDRVCDQ